VAGRLLRVIGALLGGQWQTPAVHVPLAQSLPLVQAFPAAHGGHSSPPQSTSVSPPSLMPSVHVGAAPLLDATVALVVRRGEEGSGEEDRDQERPARGDAMHLALIVEPAHGVNAVRRIALAISTPNSHLR
jgi:hypothetical protein